MDMTVKLKGIDELKKNLAKFEKKVAQRHAQKAARKGAAVIVKEAKIEAKKKFKRQSGQLQKSITSRVMRKRELRGRNSKGQKVGVRGRAFYWRYLEFGTKKMSAKPFMRPAIESKKQEAVKAIEEELRKAVQ